MDREISASLLIEEMKDYRQLSRRELLGWIETLRSRHARRTRKERAQAASVLRDREAQMRAILETAVEGIITINERGLCESFNRAAERIFGYKAREVIGRNISLLMPTPHREHHDDYLENYRSTGHAKIIGIGREVSGRRKDGTIFPMDLAVSEVGLADRRIFTGFVRDITERKRLEREILEITERERRRIGHDLHDGLCQHLAGIELMSQALEQSLARRAKAAAARGGEIARNVREAIRHTRGLARGLSPVTLESDGLMTGLQDLARNTADVFKVACDFECPQPVLVADQSAATNLFRIAQEAVSNAVKHGRARRILIRLASARGLLTLRVQDNGKGIPERMSLHQGEGMGLRIMQSRAGLIGGTLSVERNGGEGVTILCTLPESAISATRPNP
jgi:two-component system, LuxR family, sensor kinase FixL